MNTYTQHVHKHTYMRVCIYIYIHTHTCVYVYMRPKSCHNFSASRRWVHSYVPHVMQHIIQKSKMCLIVHLHMSITVKFVCMMGINTWYVLSFENIHVLSFENIQFVCMMGINTWYVLSFENIHAVQTSWYMCISTLRVHMQVHVYTRTSSMQAWHCVHKHISTSVKCYIHAYIYT